MPLNRTRLELKRFNGQMIILKLHTLNRTRLELKRGWSDNELLVEKRLIAPDWN